MKPVADLRNSDRLVQSFLKAKVSDFISNNTWQIPAEIPANIAHQIQCSTRDACSLIKDGCFMGKNIWNKVVPPSKSSTM